MLMVLLSVQVTEPKDPHSKLFQKLPPKLFQVMKFLLHLVSTGRLLIRAMPELPPNGSPTAPPKKVRPISRAANL